jgi:ABC-type branched-subunit amino acid transport system substrate-binding protein
VVLALLAGAGTLQPASAASPRITIPIGALIDQTGISTSPLYTTAVRLAVSQMNQALSQLHSEISFTVTFGDTQSSPTLSQSEAVSLIDDQHVVGLVSDSSGDTVAANKLNYQSAGPAARKVPITCFQCSSGFINDPAVTDPDPLTQAAERDLDNWLFRVFYKADFEAAVQVQLALANTGGGVGNGDGNLKIGILADNGHRSLATAIPATLSSFFTGPASTEVIFNTDLAQLPQDWARVVDGFNESTGQSDGVPDVVIMAMLPSGAAQGLLAYRQAGYTIPIQSNNSFRRNYILAGIGAIADGLDGSSVPLVAAGTSGQDFVSAFQAYAGQAPELTSSGAYDSAVTLMLASLVAARDDPTEVNPARVRAALTKINDPAGLLVRPTVADLRSAASAIRRGSAVDYDGAFNPDDWDAVGDIFPPLVHWRVVNGQFVEFQSYVCDPAHPLCPPAP